MKRTKRISVEIERREVTIALRQSLDKTVSSSPGLQSAIEPPTACPVCGGSKLLRLSVALGDYSGDHAGLAQAFAVGQIHLAAAGGAVWLCEQSFRKFDGSGEAREI